MKQYKKVYRLKESVSQFLIELLSLIAMGLLCFALCLVWGYFYG